MGDNDSDELGEGDGQESEDEWFYDSIKRYEDLLMYDVQGEISCSTFYDDHRLLLCVSREPLHELWQLSIPDKLLARKDAGLVKNRDFNLLAAGYTANSVREIVRAGPCVVVAGEGGIQLYTLPQRNDATDLISLSSTIREDVKEASLAVSENCVYSGDSLSNLAKFDLTSQKTEELAPLSRGKSLSSGRENGDKISNMFCESDNLFICLREEGHVLLCDPRTPLVSQEVEVGRTTRGLWTMDVSQNGSFVALASSSGNIKVYDLRNTRGEMYLHSLDSARSSTAALTVHLSPTESYLSVSGFDKTVKIFNYECGDKEGSSEVFSHDGHRGSSVCGIVTHLWHPTQEKLVLSADDTGTLNAWRFKQPLRS